jgi:hypothetical protein
MCTSARSTHVVQHQLHHTKLSVKHRMDRVTCSRTHQCIPVDRHYATNRPQRIIHRPCRPYRPWRFQQNISVSRRRYNPFIFARHQRPRGPRATRARQPQAFVYRVEDALLNLIKGRALYKHTPLSTQPSSPLTQFTINTNPKYHTHLNRSIRSRPVRKRRHTQQKHGRRRPPPPNDMLDVLQARSTDPGKVTRPDLMQTKVPWMLRSPCVSDIYHTRSRNIRTIPQQATPANSPAAAHGHLSHASSCTRQASSIRKRDTCMHKTANSHSQKIERPSSRCMKYAHIPDAPSLNKKKTSRRFFKYPDQPIVRTAQTQSRAGRHRPTVSQRGPTPSSNSIVSETETPPKSHSAGPIAHRACTCAPSRRFPYTHRTHRGQPQAATAVQMPTPASIAAGPLDIAPESDAQPQRETRRTCHETSSRPRLAHGVRACTQMPHPARTYEIPAHPWNADPIYRAASAPRVTGPCPGPLLQASQVPASNGTGRREQKRLSRDTPAQLHQNNTIAR